MVKGTEDYLCVGRWCMSWLKYGGKWTDWEFGVKNGVEMRFEKNSLYGDITFSKFRQKNHRFQHLEPVWNHLGHSKYLVVWVF